MTGRPQRAAKNAKKAVDDQYEGYEFLDDDEKDPFSTDEDSEGDYKPDEKSAQKISASKQKQKPLSGNVGKKKVGIGKGGKKKGEKGKGKKGEDEKGKGKEEKDEEQNDETSAPKAMKRKKVGATGKKDEKLQLAAAIRDEPIIYNLNHKLHSNLSATTAAWERIAKKVEKSVDECKKMYKSMRDALRYRKKRISGKSGDSGDDVSIDESSKDDWDMKDALSFLAPTATKFPRQVIVLGGSTETPNVNFTPDDGTPDDRIPEDDDPPKFPNDPDDEASGSTVYSYVTPRKGKKSDVVGASLSKVTESLSDFIESRKTTAVQQPAQPSLKFMYIWQNLDTLCQQLEQPAVNRLNLEFLKLTMEEIAAKDARQ